VQDKYAVCYNVGPTKYQPVMMWQEDADGGRTLRAMKWGLVPVWSKSSTPHPCPVNARAETIHEKNTFRRLVDTRRCVVLADGYFEWKRSGVAQGPYFFTSGLISPSSITTKTENASEVDVKTEEKHEGETKLSRTPFPSEHPMLRMAGLYDVWHNQETGEVLYSYTVLTVFASKLTSTIHDRMPALLWCEEDVDLWLNPKIPFQKVKYLLEPSETLTIWPVSEIVGNVKNDTPACIKPIDRSKEEKKLITSFFKPKPKQETTSNAAQSASPSQTSLPDFWAHEDLNESYVNDFGNLLEEVKVKKEGDDENELERKRNAKRSAATLPPDSGPVSKKPKRS